MKIYSHCYCIDTLLLLMKMKKYYIRVVVHTFVVVGVVVTFCSVTIDIYYIIIIIL